MAKANVTEGEEVVVISKRGPLILRSVRNSRPLSPFHSEESCSICGQFDGTLYLVIGRHLSNKRLQDFATREEIAADTIIKFRDSIGLPRLSELPSCDPRIAFVAKDDFSEVDLETTKLLFKKSNMKLLVFPLRAQLDKWDYDCTGATRAQVLASGAANEGLCYG